MSVIPRNRVRTRRAAIVNHPAVLKILRVVNLLRMVFLVRRGPLGGCLQFYAEAPYPKDPVILKILWL